MEDITDKLRNYQQIVQQLLMDYAEVKPAYGEIEVETIFDTQRNHYQIVYLGFAEKVFLWGQARVWAICYP
ncbi:XisI protein [Anabaena aphanizomenioides LEGE 00250]|jgi:hypothetical protein|uniref:XisI protein n=1 Tax=Sphaerospermopsis aphanizomenoides LEGE 00250 TaxID=2777972 RepID=A0ABR9VB77_9CYAN|nr:MULTISPECIES: element excision factor XisI family protein [Sphaerospermopsis]MBC5796307.1 XisI protein [Sphaerospermopsis sp. LEGE 00249]MBE9235392.1 XisI protein [Sphaerospermopsis aphanizomenoides LEGE 00250]